MKRVFISMFIALMAITTVQAQQIAVVSSTGATTIHRTLEAAITAATANSVIYLPGGGFPISDDVKITKKITIIGIGHKVKGNNADGRTTITGNLYFNAGSSGSAIMGCYITGDVRIGDESATVNDVLVRYCNLNSVQVLNSTCTGTLVNQNYIRRASSFNGSSVTLTNNVLSTFQGVNGGNVLYNIVTNTFYLHVIEASNSTISYNIFLNCMGGASNNGFCNGDNNQGTDNMYPFTHSEYAQFDNKKLISVSWDLVFANYLGITPASDFHFSEAYNSYTGVCGIYAGGGFSDGQLPPVPYIVAKQIPEQTDAEGKLNIKVRVNAGK